MSERSISLQTMDVTDSWRRHISFTGHQENLSGQEDNVSSLEKNRHICDYLTAASSVQVKVTCVLDMYLPPFLFVFGFVCNVLVILVMRSKFFRKLSTSFYMAINAFTDGLSLLVALPVHYLFVNFPEIFDTLRHSHPICAFFNIFGWGTSDLGILLTVAMTTERAIAIRFPLKANRLCTTRRAKFVALGLVLFEFIKLSHFAFYSKVVGVEVTSRLCEVFRDDPAYVNFTDNIWPWLHVAILALSYSLVVVGNILIVINIRRSDMESTKGGLGRKNSRKDSTSGSRNRQLSVMLVVDSCFLVICTLPFAIIVILISKFNMLPAAEGGKNLAYTASFYMLYLNRCLNFFLYCVSGSRFRAALRGIFTLPSFSASNDNKSNSRERPVSASGRLSVDNNRNTRADRTNNQTVCPLSPSSEPAESQETSSFNTLSNNNIQTEDVSSDLSSDSIYGPEPLSQNSARQGSTFSVHEQEFDRSSRNVSEDNSTHRAFSNKGFVNDSPSFGRKEQEREPNNSDEGERHPTVSELITHINPCFVLDDYYSQEYEHDIRLTLTPRNLDVSNFLLPDIFHTDQGKATSDPIPVTCPSISESINARYKPFSPRGRDPRSQALTQDIVSPNDRCLLSESGLNHDHNSTLKSTCSKGNSDEIVTPMLTKPSFCTTDSCQRLPTDQNCTQNLNHGQLKNSTNFATRSNKTTRSSSGEEEFQSTVHCIENDSFKSYKDKCKQEDLHKEAGKEGTSDQRFSTYL